jgi:hypothetical protein
VPPKELVVPPVVGGLVPLDLLLHCLFHHCLGLDGVPPELEPPEGWRWLDDRSPPKAGTVLEGFIVVVTRAVGGVAALCASVNS